MKRMLADVREDLIPLMGELKKDFELVGVSELNGTLPPDPLYLDDHYKWTLLSPQGRHVEVDGSGWIRTIWPKLASCADGVLKEKDIHAGFLWNTVMPFHATAALALRSRKIPVFEACHWSISTYLQGHFEDVSLADHVFCSQEHAAFAKWSESPSTYHAVGKPLYDEWEPRDAMALRKDWGLPVEGPYVLKTSTWTHGLSAWSDQEYYAAHELASIQALVALKERWPNLTVLWSTRTEDPKKVGERLREMGMEDTMVTHDTWIKDLIDISDVVLCQKSGAAVDAIICERPGVIVDFKPQLDTFKWKPGVIRAVRSPEEIVEAIENLFEGPKRDEMIEAQRREKVWYGKTGNAAQRAAEIVREVCS